MSRKQPPPPPMVLVRTVPTAFHARVLAARLGAEGMLTELRGNVGGPYPLGDVSVWVAAADAESATELLLADEVEAAFDEEHDPAADTAVRGLLGRRRLLAGMGLAAVAATLAVAHAGL